MCPTNGKGVGAFSAYVYVQPNTYCEPAQGGAAGAGLFNILRNIQRGVAVGSIRIHLLLQLVATRGRAPRRQCPTGKRFLR